MNITIPEGAQLRAVSDLIPYARNARTHSEAQVAQIAASIREFGWTNPVLIDAEGGVIAGHGRLLAARQLGMEAVPIIELAHLTDAQKRAYILADNRLAESAGWDEELLRIELGALQDEGYRLEVIGFDAKQLAELLVADPIEGNTDPDDVPRVRAQAITRPGETWILGEHRVACGDATSSEDVARAVDGQAVDCVWTDPPYNVAYEGGTKDRLTIMNDEMDAASFRSFLTQAFRAAATVCRPGGAVYIAHADSEGINFRLAMTDAGWLHKQTLIWVKNSLVLGRQDYHWQHEPILYGWKPGAGHAWYGDRTKTTVLDDDLDLERASKAEMLEILKAMRAASTVIRQDKPSRNDVHPTMKPVALIETMLLNSSKAGDAVFDPFGGSGSTLIACHKHRRRARLLELDPVYVDVIVRRWQAFTGQKATLEGEGITFAEAEAARHLPETTNA